jgi:type II secretory pathway pseudopilin PulG
MARQSAKFEIPKPVQVALGLAVVGGGVYAAYKLIASINAAIERKKAQSQLNLIAGELQALDQTAGQKITLPLSQYNVLADQIEQACIGSWYDPTDEDAIYDAFGQLNNNADYLKLQQVFGSRDGWTLNEWIKGDLSTSERQKVNDILAMKSITYRI